MKLRSRIALCIRILRAYPCGLLAHTEAELPAIGKDEMGLMMANNLRELVLVFCTQGHSGFSASYATSALSKLLAYEPLSPLRGTDDEWIQVSEHTWQNRRCSHVFKDSERFDGQPYDINAVVFREANGACFTGRGSHQVIAFPYTPNTVYVDVDAEGNPLDGWNREGNCPAWTSA